MSADRFAERRRRALEAAEATGLAGILVSPGPDLAYLMAYAPLPLERLTLLVLSTGTDPTLVVPTLERPLAERAAGAPGLTLRDWRDGSDDPYAFVAGMLGSGRYAVTDRTWASHLLALERAGPERSFVAAGEALPLLRAVKDPDEIERQRRVRGEVGQVGARRDQQTGEPRCLRSLEGIAAALGVSVVAHSFIWIGWAMISTVAGVVPSSSPSDSIGSGRSASITSSRLTRYSSTWSCGMCSPR